MIFPENPFTRFPDHPLGLCVGLPQLPPSRAKLLAVDAGLGQHLADRVRIGRLVSLVESFEHQLRIAARDGKALRDRRALLEHAGKILVGPQRRKIDAAVVEEIGSDQAGSSSMVQKLLNLIADVCPCANGVPANCAATWKLSGARGWFSVAGAGTSQSHANVPRSTVMSHGSRIITP